MAPRCRRSCLALKPLMTLIWPGNVTPPDIRRLQRALLFCPVAHNRQDCHIQWGVSNMGYAEQDTCNICFCIYLFPHAYMSPQEPNWYILPICVCLCEVIPELTAHHTITKSSILKETQNSHRRQIVKCQAKSDWWDFTASYLATVTRQADITWVVGGVGWPAKFAAKNEWNTLFSTNMCNWLKGVDSHCVIHLNWKAWPRPNQLKYPFILIAKREDKSKGFKQIQVVHFQVCYNHE